MGLLGKKEKAQDSMQPSELVKKKKIGRPKICLFDLSEESKLLEEEGYNIYSGSLKGRRHSK